MSACDAGGLDRRQAGVVLDWDDDDPVADHDGPCCLHRGGPP